MKGKRRLPLVLALLLLLTLLPARATGTDRANTLAAGGQAHSLAVQEDGTVLVWGDNSAGQLGLGGDVAEIRKPTAVEGVSAVSVAAGEDFSAALRYDGAVYTWGHGVHAAPVQAAIDQVAAIAAGGEVVLALKTDGTVWQWTYGGAISRVSGLSRVAAIATGGGHHLALTVSGEVWAWGKNDRGQLGDGTAVDRAAPVKVPGLVDVVDVAAGAAHSLAVTFDGRVYAWGSNDCGQLGHAEGDRRTPSEVAELTKVVQVAAGKDSSMALTQGGTVYTWGCGEYGQLGSSRRQNTQSRPYTISMPGSGMAQIAAGAYHDLAVTNGGVLYAWGRNQRYQLGNSRNENADSPVRVLTGTGSGGAYPVSWTDGISDWARPYAEELYPTGLVPPMLWGGYQAGITRGELAHLLVSVYEQVRGTAPTPSAANKFNDLQGHLLETDLRKAYGLELLGGTSGTTLSPDRRVTRQEAAKMLCCFVGRMEGISIPAGMQSLAFYRDAGQIAEWAVPYVHYAHENHIMEGNAAGGFAPLDRLTREQSLVILARLVEQYGWIK